MLFLTAKGPLAIFGVIGLIYFATTMAIGVVPAFIQLITPRTSRGLLSATYVFVINFFGLGIAPALIGSLSARSPNDPYALRAAISEVTLPAAVVAVVLLWLLFRRYSLQQNEALSG
jgi:hypothetical protein